MEQLFRDMALVEALSITFEDSDADLARLFMSEQMNIPNARKFVRRLQQDPRIPNEYTCSGEESEAILQQFFEQQPIRLCYLNRNELKCLFKSRFRLRTPEDLENFVENHLDNIDEVGDLEGVSEVELRDYLADLLGIEVYDTLDLNRLELLQLYAIRARGFSDPHLRISRLVGNDGRRVCHIRCMLDGSQSVLEVRKSLGYVNENNSFTAYLSTNVYPALSALLGERPDFKAIRTGCERAGYRRRPQIQVQTSHSSEGINFTIKIDINPSEVDLQMIWGLHRTLVRLTQDNDLAIRDVTEGCLKITFRGSVTGYQRIRELWESGQLGERMGIPATIIDVRREWSVQEWLQHGISTAAQQLGWRRIELEPVALSYGAESRPSGDRNLSARAISRQLEIEGQRYELRVFLSPESTSERTLWRIQLQNLNPAGEIPSGFKLRLLTEDRNPFEGNEDTSATAEKELYIDVYLEPEEGLILETEPSPDQLFSGTEVLRF